MYKVCTIALLFIFLVGCTENMDKLKSAREHLRAGDFQNAINIFTEVDPTGYSKEIERARESLKVIDESDLLIKEGKYNESIEKLSRISVLYTDEAQKQWTERAKVLINSEMLKKAESLYNKKDLKASKDYYQKIVDSDIDDPQKGEAREKLALIDEALGLNKKSETAETEPVIKRRRKIQIGMTADEVINETYWGKPKDINKTTTVYGVDELWSYAGSRYLYFEDGILTTINE